MGCGKTPSTPDYGKAAAAGVMADLANYPSTYLINAAASTGGKTTIGGKEYDFTGLGNADTAAKVSDQMAQTLLDIQREHSGAQIAQRLKELQVADPKGYAARQQLFDSIMASVQAQPDRPLAQSLQDKVLAELKLGGELDKRGREQVQGQVRGGQIKRGIMLGNAPAEQEAAAMVSAADLIRSQRQTGATDFLASGVSPEDVAYRRMQQNLSNLGSFVNGVTPTAQFRNLSGAQNLATPIAAAPINPATFSTNAGELGLSNAAAIYSGQVNWANSQVNPWMAGISTGVSAGNVANAWGAGKTTTPANSNVSAWGAPKGTTYNAAADTYQAPYTGWGTW